MAGIRTRPQGTLGIPRADMPQSQKPNIAALVNFLNARGRAHEQDEEVDPPR